MMETSMKAGLPTVQHDNFMQPDDDARNLGIVDSPIVKKAV